MLEASVDEKRVLRQSVFWSGLCQIFPDCLAHPHWHQWQVSVWWQKKFKQPLSCPGDVQALVCKESNGARRLLALLSQSVPETRKAANQLGSLELELLVCLTLLAADVLVRQRQICDEVASVHGLDLGMDSAKAAALVGACWFDRRLHLVRSGGPEGYAFANVVEDVQALELGFTSPRDALDAELVALYECAANPTSANRQETLWRLKRDQNPTKETIQFYLEELANPTEQRMQVMVCLPHQRASIFPEEVRSEFVKDYDVPLIFYGQKAQQETKGLQGDLMTLVVANVFKKIFQTEEDLAMETTVFVSYAHKDEKWKDALVEHLGVLEQQGRVSVWVDTQIQTGDDWLPEIEGAMRQARVAVLLVSSAFLASKFIQGTEVPRLLGRRKSEGLRVIPVLVRECAWETVDWLKPIQMSHGSIAPDYEKESERDKVLADVARQVNQCLGRT